MAKRDGREYPETEGTGAREQAIPVPRSNDGIPADVEEIAMNDRRRLLVWSIAKITAVALPIAVMSAPAQAAPQPKPVKASKPLKVGAHANWTGVWVLADSYLDRQDGSSIAFRTGREEDDAQFKDMFLKPPKLTPEAAKRAQAETAKAAEGVAVNRRQCRPSGMPSFWAGFYAFEMVQSPDQLNIFQEGGVQTRRIHLDGRKHPSLDDSEPLIQGHSIGHWEGDDLVVDTVNLNTDVEILGPGSNHTEKSHITERFRPVGPDRIDVDVTVENPDVLAEPYKLLRRLKRKPGMEILDYDCEENNRNPIDAQGREHVILAPGK